MTFDRKFWGAVAILIGTIIGAATSHITNAKNAIDKVNNEFTRLSGKIDQTKLLK